jgi:hypothetical protein
MSNGFEMVAMTAIIANCIIMAMTHADMDATWRDLMTWANLHGLLHAGDPAEVHSPGLQASLEGEGLWVCCLHCELSLS